MDDFQKKLIEYIYNRYAHTETERHVSHPPQGMSSGVFFIRLSDQEYAVKYGKDATKDVDAITLIKDRGVHVPVPDFFSSFVFETVPVLILKKVEFPLLDSVPKDTIAEYVPSMIAVMKELHTIKSETPYVVSGGIKFSSWNDYILAQFDGKTINWDEVLQRSVLDSTLISAAIEKFIATLHILDLSLSEYSLLHTDFNQRNLFVDPNTHTIQGVIDWEDAVFGDPLYDFARIRMLLWHFDVPESTLHTYYTIVKFTEHEIQRERLYWVSRVIQYLAWYSEEETPFNLSRIVLHQNFLREYVW